MECKQQLAWMRKEMKNLERGKGQKKRTEAEGLRNNDRMREIKGLRRGDIETLSRGKRRSVNDRKKSEKEK